MLKYKDIVWSCWKQQVNKKIKSSYTKEWEGFVEKEFTIVMYADSRYKDDAKKAEHYFSLSLEGSSAKCPPAIFGEDVTEIPNDANIVMDKIIEFVS